MEKSCCVDGCTNNQAKHPELAFYTIPEEPPRRLAWLKAIGRIGSDAEDTDKLSDTNSDKQYVCSVHLPSGEKIMDQNNPDIIPSIAPLKGPAAEQVEKTDGTVEQMKETAQEKEKILDSNHPDFNPSTSPLEGLAAEHEEKTAARTELAEETAQKNEKILDTDHSAEHVEKTGAGTEPVEETAKESGKILDSNPQDFTPSEPLLKEPAGEHVEKADGSVELMKETAKETDTSELPSATLCSNPPNKSGKSDTSSGFPLTPDPGTRYFLSHDTESVPSHPVVEKNNQNNLMPGYDMTPVIPARLETSSQGNTDKMASEQVPSCSQSQDFSDLLEAFDISDLPKELDDQAAKKGQEQSPGTGDAVQPDAARRTPEEVCGQGEKAKPSDTNNAARTDSAEKPENNGSVEEKTQEAQAESEATAEQTQVEGSSEDTGNNGAADFTRAENNSHSVCSAVDSVNLRIDNVRSVDPAFHSEISSEPTNTQDDCVVVSSPLASGNSSTADSVIVKQEALDNQVINIQPQEFTTPVSAPMQQNLQKSLLFPVVPFQQSQISKKSTASKYVLVSRPTVTKAPQRRGSLAASKALTRLVRVVENPSKTTFVQQLEKVTENKVAKYPPVAPAKPPPPYRTIMPRSHGHSSILVVPSVQPTPTEHPVSVVSSTNPKPSVRIIAAPIAMSSSNTSNSSRLVQVVQQNPSSNIIHVQRSAPSIVVVSSSQANVGQTSQSLTIVPSITAARSTCSVPNSASEINLSAIQNGTKGIKLDQVCDILLQPKSVQKYSAPDPPEHLKDVTKNMSKHVCHECGDSFWLESSWANHRRRRTCIITLDCPVCKKTIICYNRCVLMAHLNLHKGQATIHDAWYQPLPKNLLKNVMDVQMEPEPQKSITEIVDGLYANGLANGINNNHSESGMCTSEHIRGVLDTCSKSSDESGANDAGRGSGKGSGTNRSNDSSPSQKVGRDKKEHSVDELLVHPDNGFVCVECNSKFKERSKLKAHYTNVRRNGFFQFRCWTCSQYLPSGCALRSHMRIHKDNMPYVCPECGAIVADKAILQDHLHRMCFHSHRRVNMHCTKCTEVVHSPDEFVNHTREAHVELYLKCQRCPMAFRSTEGVTRHAEKNHNTSSPCWKNIYKCPLCDTVFHHSHQLQQHLRMHVNDKQSQPDTMLVYHCQHCQEDFHSHSSYRWHLKQQHGVKIIICLCNVCGARFKNEPELILHQKASHGADSYQCDKCPEVLNSDESLTRHKAQAHSLQVTIKDIGVKKVKSPSKAYKLKKPSFGEQGHNNSDDSKDDEDDVDIKDVPKWIPCSECGHRYPNAESLQSHIRLDHKEGKSSLPCHFCGVVLADSAAMQAHIDSIHIRKHSNKYVCNLCSQEGRLNMFFPNSTNLEKHLKTSHRLTRTLIDLDLFLVRSDSPEERLKREGSSDSDNSQPAAKRLRLEGEETYSCAKCEFSCTQREEFLQHIEDHKLEGGDAHQCQECGMSFVTQTALKRHLFMVHKIRNLTKYQSDTGVDLVTPEKEVELHTVANQMNGHVEPEPKSDNPLECTVCYKAFETSGALRNHMRSHGMAFIRSKRNISCASDSDSNLS